MNHEPTSANDRLKSNPYSPPEFSTQPNDAKSLINSHGTLVERLRLPGIALLILYLSHIIWEFGLFFFNISIAKGEVAGILCNSEPIPVTFFRVIVFWGLWNMLKLRLMGTAYLSVIVSCCPYLAAWYILSIPFGIWAVIVLNDPRNGLLSCRTAE